MKTCAVIGCLRPYHVAGFCNKHYQSKMIYGDPLKARIKRADGEGSIKLGYLVIQKDKVKRFEHVIIAEKALGKPLPDKAEVHHMNENRLDNRTSNLVICPDRSYHFLLHQRMRAFDACGNANFRKCSICKKYDDVSLMKHSPYKRKLWWYYHLDCMRSYRRARYAKARDAAIRDAPQ